MGDRAGCALDYMSAAVDPETFEVTPLFYGKGTKEIPLCGFTIETCQFFDRFGYPFTRGRLFFTMEEDRGQYDDGRDVFWATGAALLVRLLATRFPGTYGAG